MKKKIIRHKSGLPLLEDDYSFGSVAGQPEQQSFSEMFDPSAFDREVSAVPGRERDGGPARKMSHPSPQEYLDLHGLTAAQAESRVTNFLLTSRNKGLRAVAVITGKGMHSQGQPVLRELVERMAKVMKAGGKISSYGWENGQRERSGTIIIYL